MLVKGARLAGSGKPPETLGWLLRFQALTMGNGDCAITSGQLVR